MNTSFTDELAQTLKAVQGIDDTTAREVAEKIVDSNEPDVLEVARIWLMSGSFPASPEVAGFTPQDLDKEFLPSQVLMLLLGLRRHADQTIQVMRRMPGRRALGLETNAARLRQRVFVLASHLATQARQLYDEAIAIGLDKPLAHGLEAHARDLELLRDQLHDALLTDEDKANGAEPRIQS